MHIYCVNTDGVQQVIANLFRTSHSSNQPPHSPEIIKFHRVASNFTGNAIRFIKRRQDTSKFQQMPSTRIEASPKSIMFHQHSPNFIMCSPKFIKQHRIIIGITPIIIKLDRVFICFHRHFIKVHRIFVMSYQKIDPGS